MEQTLKLALSFLAESDEISQSMKLSTDKLTPWLLLRDDES
jgi:hypothetical protein